MVPVNWLMSNWSWNWKLGVFFWLGISEWSRVEGDRTVVSSVLENSTLQLTCLPLALVKLVKLWKFSCPFPAITGNRLGPPVLCSVRSWRIDNREIASSFLFRFCVCVCFQKNKLIRTLGESLSSCFCGCRWAWAFAPVQVAVGQSFPIFPLAATNKGSCQSKLYRRRFTSIHPRAHTHTLTQTHLHIGV